MGKKNVIPENYVKVRSNSVRNRTLTLGGVNVHFDEKGVGHVAPHDLPAVEREMAARPNRFSIEKPEPKAIQEVAVSAPVVVSKAVEVVDVTAKELPVAATPTVTEKQAELPVVVDRMPTPKKKFNKTEEDKKE